jgi:hypothetical protein
MEREQIEYEAVTVQMPKQIMDYLRSIERCIKMTPKEYIEYNIVDCVRADIDSFDDFVTPKELADGWQLNPIFKAITNTEVI